MWHEFFFTTKARNTAAPETGMKVEARRKAHHPDHNYLSGGVRDKL